MDHNHGNNVINSSKLCLLAICTQGFDVTATAAEATATAAAGVAAAASKAPGQVVVY